MENNMYWLTTMVFAVILHVILSNDIKVKITPSKVEMKFRRLLIWVIFFCLQDTLWGLCSSRTISSDSVFFLASSLFHISTVVTTVFWLDYVLEYLGDRVKKRGFFICLEAAIIGFEFVLVVANFFTPTLFRIVDGQYVVGPLRLLTFINQYMIFLVIGFTTLYFAVKERAKERRRLLCVFVFIIAPIIMGVLQLAFPEAPFYCIGYFVGCFVVHIFVVAKEREEAQKAGVFKSIADTYYTMHLVDLEAMTLEPYIEPERITKLKAGAKNAQEQMNRAFSGTVSDEYYNKVINFIDMSDISERMKESNIITCEFVAKNYGWTRISFVSVERENDIQKKLMLITQIIDEEKKTRLDLIYKSNNDELTGLYNRRAFDNEIEELQNGKMDKNLAILSMDVNELKIVNDTKGHPAGDEMLVGAAYCMKRALSAYGKVFRTGGDEFNAIIHADEAQLLKIRSDFEDTVQAWSGKLVDQISVSIGSATLSDSSDKSLNELIAIADARMYEDKTAYYRKKGVDRRGQKDAHTALCALYTKILKVNITEDSYQIVDMSADEKSVDKGFADTFSKWLHDFAVSGNVYTEDLDEYINKTNLSRIGEHFRRTRAPYIFFYRRKFNEGFRKVMLEIIPANDYSDDSQNLYVYVKKVES